MARLGLLWAWRLNGMAAVFSMVYAVLLTAAGLYALYLLYTEPAREWFRS